MRSEQIVIPHRSKGSVVVQAWPTGVPGLVVNSAYYDDGSRVFGLTHRRSGCAVLFFNSPEAALAAAQDLAGVTDWTQPAAAFVVAGGVPAAVAAVHRRYDGIQGKATGPTAPDLNGGGTA